MKKVSLLASIIASASIKPLREEDSMITEGEVVTVSVRIARAIMKEAGELDPEEDISIHTYGS